MGFGDELMAAGMARAVHERTHRRVKILDKRGAPRWHDLWEGSPAIVRPGDVGLFETVVNGPSARPYIDYAKSGDKRWGWKPYKPNAAQLFGLQNDQRAAGKLLIEPSLKARASSNKRWPFWPQFRKQAEAAGLRLAQPCQPGAPALEGVERIETPTFRQACALLAHAAGIVTHEGGLHHAAAALGKQAVVIFGGFISPAQTGYDSHVNLFTGGEPCGWRVPCAHCAAAMRQITPEMVVTESLRLFRKQEAA